MVGPPLPPALNIPQPIADLRTEVTGDKIIVHFTPPALTGERLPITKLRAIELLIGPSDPNFSQQRWASTAHRYALSVDDLGPRDFSVPSTEWAGKEIVIGARTIGPSGRASDWSNLNILNVNAPLATPRLDAPRATAKGVALTWSGDAQRYRILRATLSDPEPKLEPVGESTARDFVDPDAEFGTRYRYVILGLGGESQQSLPSEPVEIQPVDTFGPATPTGLSAVAGVTSIDLSWTQNTEDDLAGYNLFRAVDDGPFTLVLGGIAVPAFTDPNVQSGKRYRYTLSAVDKTGNESQRSPETATRIE
ncbi:MAG: hypothetical protein WDO18_14160 [Acidobacteriota bacterium]